MTEAIDRFGFTPTLAGVWLAIILVLFAGLVAALWYNAKLKGPLFLLIRTTWHPRAVEDERVIATGYDVDTFVIDHLVGIRFVVNQVRMVCWVLARFARAQAFFHTFVDYYSLPVAMLASLRGVPSLIVVDGAIDAHYLPELKYGVWHRRFRRWCVKTAIRRSILLASHPSLLSCPAEPSYASQYDVTIGVYRLAGIAEAERNDATVSPGYAELDPGNEEPAEGYAQPDVIFVAGLSPWITPRAHWAYAERKGLSTVVEAAKLLPDVGFHLVGMGPEFIAEHFPGADTCTNLHVHGYVASNILMGMLRQTRVYALPSVADGMTYGLAQAMLAGCVPVVSALRTHGHMVGDTGVLVPSSNPDDWASGIRRGLEMAPSDRGASMAAARIRAQFGSERHSGALLEAIARYV